MKTKRNLSGIYYRVQNKDTKEWEDRVFEDLETENQLNIINNCSDLQLKTLVRILADTINDIGEAVDIYKSDLDEA